MKYTEKALKIKDQFFAELDKLIKGNLEEINSNTDVINNTTMYKAVKKSIVDMSNALDSGNFPEMSELLSDSDREAFRSRFRKFLADRNMGAK